MLRNKVCLYKKGLIINQTNCFQMAKVYIFNTKRLLLGSNRLQLILIPLFINDKLEFDGITTALSHWQSYPRFWRWYQF